MGAGGLRAASPGCQKRQRKLGSGGRGQGEPVFSPAAHPSPRQPAGQDGATDLASPPGVQGADPLPGLPLRGPGTSWKRRERGGEAGGPQRAGEACGRGPAALVAWLGTGLSAQPCLCARARAHVCARARLCGSGLAGLLGRGWGISSPGRGGQGSSLRNRGGGGLFGGALGTRGSGHAAAGAGRAGG